MTEAPLVQVSGLKRVFDVSRPWLDRVIARESRQLLKAVDGVSFDIKRGETFALVGNPDRENRPSPEWSSVCCRRPLARF